jgi:adenylate cyclase
VLFFLAGAREKLGSYGVAIAGVVLPIIALLIHAQLLSKANIWLGWVSPALFAVLAASAMMLHEYTRVRLERTRVLGNLSSYLPIDIAQEIAYTLPNSSISAQRKDATLLSADLRNFSAYGESRPPEESAALLHYFFVRATEIVEKFEGRVHEFKGDSLLAIWDGSDSKAAHNALCAALELQSTIQEVLPQTPPAGLEPLALGIGIEQGPVLIGSIGPAHRRSHTLLGETVTITLRIQEMTAELAHPILVGECAARQLSDQGLISQGSYLLNGLRKPHILYAPTLPEPVVLVTHEVPALKVLRGGRH